VLVLEWNRHLETHEWPPSRADLKQLTARVQTQPELAILRRLKCRPPDLVFTDFAYPDHLLGETLTDFLLAGVAQG